MVVLGAGWFDASGTVAQVQNNTAGETVGRSAVAQQAVAKKAAAAVARIAMADLKATGTPAPRDYLVASELLEIARRISPQDQDLLRLLIEARIGQGDESAVDELSRELLVLDPADTVTQLRVCSSAISRSQNADDRLAAYERFLSSDAAGIDPSVRSRLALDAALMSREQGDMRGFERRLTQALELDSTNKDAATLALTFFAESVGDPVGRMDLLLNVLLADPFDPQVHLGIARELARNGAYNGALRFFNTSFELATSRGEQLPQDVRDEASVVDWVVRGAEAFVASINEEILTARAHVTRQREQAELSPEPPAELPDPSNVRLPLEVERLRILASVSLGDDKLIDDAVAEMAQTVARGKDLVLDLRRRPESLTDEQAAEFVRSLTAESIWLRLWAGREISVASQDLAEIRNNPATDPKDVERMEAWLRLRYREFDDAERRLRELGNDNLGVVGLAVLSDMKGDTAKAIERYAEIARRLPASPAGAFAYTRANVLAAGSSLPPLVPESSARLESLAASVPDWLERMYENPMEFMTLRADLIAGAEGRIGLFDKVGIRLRLRNVSRIPLGVGPDRPINSRLLVVPSMRFGSIPVRRQTLNGVLSLDRRLRLLPREELVVELWPDNGTSGLTIQEELRRAVEVRWRLLQGFTPGEGGVFQEGPMCLTADVGPAVRPAVDSAYLKADELAKLARTGTGEQLAEVILVIRDLVFAPEGIRLVPEDAAVVLNEVLLRFPTLSKEEKLLILATAPTATRLPPMSSLDDIASRDRDLDIVSFVMLSRLNSPDHALLNESLWADQPAYLENVRVIKQRLQDGVSTYARPVLPETDPQGAGDPSSSLGGAMDGTTRP